MKTIVLSLLAACALLLLKSCTIDPKRSIVVYIDSGVPYTNTYTWDAKSTYMYPSGYIARFDSTITTESARKRGVVDYKYYNKWVYINWDNIAWRYADDTNNINTPNSAGDTHVYQTGKRGGQYYINSKGNKTYKKK